MIHTIDWIIIISFLILSLAIGLKFRNRASKDLTSFFLGGRSLPWYIAGISMVATTFAADTPLAVSELVSTKGVSNNWVWWSFLAGGMLTTFFFSKLWRRAEILTELEFIDIRYDGKPARFLRGFKAIYLGVFINCMIIGWVNLAFNTLLIEFFDISESSVWLYTGGAMVIAVIYTSLSGLLGVAITDTIQFIIAMIGCIILSVIVLNSEEVGGIENLKASIDPSYFHFFPTVGNESITTTLSLSIGAFLSFVLIQWWASWYPGSEPGGGGYVAQRMMSTKTEKDSFFATFFFQIAHYCLRPWPWVIVGLCAVYLYSPEYVLSNSQVFEQFTSLKSQGFSFNEIQSKLGLSISEINSLKYHESPRLGYVFAMKEFLPAGLTGLLLVSFIAAYLSTISTQLNWGASFIVNDFIKPFTPLKNSLSHSGFVKVSRITTVVLMILGLIISSFLTSISGVWIFIMECGAGLGLVLILRWYWWRINAWSEITATISPFIWYLISIYFLEPNFGKAFIENRGTFIFTVVMTTITWILATYLTKPEPIYKLESFYNKVRPSGNWRVIKNSKENKEGLKNLGISWLSSIVCIYSILIFIGKLIFKEWNDVLISGLVIVVSGIILKRYINKTSLFN